MHTTSYCMDNYIYAQAIFYQINAFYYKPLREKVVACTSSVDMQTLQKATHKYPLDLKPGIHLP